MSENSKHEEQPNDTLEELRQGFQELRQQCSAFEHKLQIMKENNERFGRELEAARDQMRIVVEEVQTLRLERMERERSEKTQPESEEVNIVLADDEDLGAVRSLNMHRLLQVVSDKAELGSR
ncbi:uncharacterized protein TRIVIDRAFT_61246 [Trichoderma virens Gv29-8]|uniref:Uncharacterized protein n=1 Tax=Hypocrea virens (strain Gv29-8 / FGSC 10586) TaxID=413071 RepID=G9MM84_HYPVG|nr:uncharacterized protein TRIVIDRAFT_61246 [Trichoderma virens Gv29-8]EHK24453.1 hypothetical protein TRIVIDRAFT_61246 [Trichoderma virens Gv29-8]UKZ54725.1 hypothetical protein TrVGV298_008537 [Trichoderma virens]